MSATIYELFIQGLAILLTGIAVKMLDDYLDEPEGWIECLERGVPAYGMLFLALGVGLAPSTSLSLFLASYALGMIHEPDRQLPLGLQAYQENILVLTVGFIILGWKEILSSLSILLAVQLIDDTLDQKLDTSMGHPNIRNHLGVVETVLLSMISLLIAAYLHPSKTFLVIITTVILICSKKHLDKRVHRRELSANGN